nr:peptidylprolyl isomerase [uncultured Dorea sp.]
MKKRALILAMAGILSTSLTGCGSLKDDAVVVKAGDTEITAGVANFYARYTQAQYETYLSGYLGGDDMWSKNASDGKTYEESIKDTLLDDLKNMALLEEHMDEYKVSLTKADKKAVNDAAKEFDKANSKKVKDKISASKENVKRTMTLMTIEQRMRKAIVADADVKVSDEDAAQKRMQYVAFDYSSSDASDDEKAQVKQKAEAFAEGAKKADDFEAYATGQGAEAKTATFDSDSVNPSAEVVKAADKLGEGEVTGVIEADGGCYVAKVTSLMDKTATETKKESLISDKQDKYYKKILKKWKKEEKITVHKGNWNKVSFTKLSVKIKDDSTTTGTDSTSSTDAAATDSAN